MAKYAVVQRADLTQLRWYAGQAPTVGGDSLGFHNTLFPEGIQYSSSGAPGFNTTLIQLGSGKVEAVSRWPKPVRRYNAVHDVKSRDQLAAIMDFLIARDGSANLFRFRDFSDETTAPNHRDEPTKDDVVIGVGDGSTKIFQLKKVYTNSNQTKERVIRLPLTPGWGHTPLVCINGGGALTYNTHFTVDDTTGLLVFDTAPSDGGVITAGFKFHVPVRFGDTADKALALAIESFGHGSLPSVELIEGLDDILLPEDYDYGWGSELTFGADFIITPNMGRSLTLNTTAAVSAFLLDPNLLPLGNYHHNVWNASGSFSVTLLNYDGTTLDGGTVLAPGNTKSLHIFPYLSQHVWKVTA